MAKEKEFMANTRILAMSNIIDTFTTTQSKQGFYGKQLMIIGVTAPSPTYAGVSGADLEITVKVRCHHHRRRKVSSGYEAENIILTICFWPWLSFFFRALLAPRH